MSKFEILTKYISQFNDDNFGDWVIDRENDGSEERPTQTPSVNYSETVHHFTADVYAFGENNKDMTLNQYGKILNENDLEWSTESMEGADVSSLNPQCIMALIIGAVRAERFCDGALLSFFKNGSILEWLQRLKEIDES